MKAAPFTTHRAAGATAARSVATGRRDGPSRLRPIVIAIMLLIALFTSACAAGQQAQTSDQLPTIDGTEATIGNIKLRGLAIDAPTGPYYVAGNNATVKLVIVNDGQSADQLTGVSSAAITSWGSFANAADALTNSNPSRSVAIAAGSRVSYSVPDASTALGLIGLKTRLYPGSSVAMTFTFARAGSVTVTVPVALSTTPVTSILPTPSGSDASG